MVMLPPTYMYALTLSQNLDFDGKLLCPRFVHGDKVVKNSFSKYVIVFGSGPEKIPCLGT